jgi:hypothetical protein
MAAGLDGADTMAKAQKTSPVRLTEEAIRWARIASGYTGESMAEYVSRIVAERGRQDVERLHAHLASEPSAAPGPTAARKAPGRKVGVK